MPHLTRNMVRPSVSEKVKIHLQCEGPEFHQMSKDYPIPEIPDELVAEYRTAGAFMITCSTDARRSRVHSDNWFASINKQPSPGFRPSENRYGAATTSSVKNSVHIPSSGSNERKTAMLSSVVPEAASVVAQNQAHVHGNGNSTTVQPRSSATFIASNYQNTLNMNQQICGNNVAPTYIFTQPALSRNLRPAIGMNTANTQPALMIQLTQRFIVVVIAWEEPIMYRYGMQSSSKRVLVEIFVMGKTEKCCSRWNHLWCCSVMCGVWGVV